MSGLVKRSGESPLVLACCTLLFSSCFYFLKCYNNWRCLFSPLREARAWLCGHRSVLALGTAGCPQSHHVLPRGASSGAPAPRPRCGMGDRRVNPRLVLNLGGCDPAVPTCTGRCCRGFLPPAPGSKGGLLAMPLCCLKAAGIAASLRGGGRLVALSCPGFLFFCCV